MKNFNKVNRARWAKKKHLFLKSLLIAIGLLVTSLTTPTWAKKVWIDVSSVTGYADKMQVHFWGGTRDTYVWASSTVVSNLYYAEIDADAIYWQTCRGNSLSDHWDNSGDDVTYADYNKYSVTGWKNSGTKGNVTTPFIIAGNGSGYWLGGADWSCSTTSNAISSSKTYSNCAAGIKVFRIVPYAIWDDDHGYTEVTSSNVPYITNSDNNSIVFVTNKTANITIGFDGENISISVANTDGSDPMDAILGGDYVMFYMGDKWNTNKKYLHIDSSNKDYFHAEVFTTINSENIAVGIGKKNTRYYVSHSMDWVELQMENYVVQGTKYINYNDGSNKQSASPSTIPSISDQTVAVGATSSGISASASPNYSALGSSYTYSYTYYYTQNSGTTWTEFDPSDVSDLAVGTYKVRALAFDGNIYIVSNEATLEIQNVPGVSLSVSSAGPIASGTELTLTATPTNTTVTPTFSYYYKIGDGSYTDIAGTEETPVESTSQTFTPAVNSPGTYTFKVVMHHNSSDYPCTVFPTTDVQQRRTIAVKNKFTDLYGYNTIVDASTPSVTGIYNTLSVTRDVAPDGYAFAGWEKTSSLSFVTGDATSSSTSVVMSASADDQTLTALYTAKKRIYFDNSSSHWDGDIYVYMLKEASWWDKMDKDGQGPGLVLKNKNGYERYYEYAKMTRIEGTDVYYYEYTNHSVYVAFTKGDYHLSAGVYGTSAAYRGDFNECAPLYIASGTWTTTNSTGFHNAGYWKRHGTTHSGFSLWIDEGGSRWVEHEFTNNDPSSSVYTTSVDFSSANTVYGYNVARCFGGKKLRRADYSGDLQDSDSDWPRELGESDYDGGLRTSSAGTYNFTLSLTNDHIYMTVEYPVSIGDYRVVLDNGTKVHSTGRVLRARTVEKTDTISVFIDHTKAASNTLYVDTCSYTGDPLGWTRVAGVAAATMSLNKKPYNEKTGVYNFAVTRTNRTDVTIVELDEKEYEGDFYIRTDVADGHWTAYMTTKDNKMHYSALSLSKSNYNYYFTKWAKKGKNMHYTIANNYSPCISDTLKSDATYLVGTNNDELPDSANVRFTWNSETNGLSRAFINGANSKQRFLVLTGDAKTFDKDGVAIPETPSKELAANELEFEDMGNWVYQIDLTGQTGSTVNVTAKYNGNTQNFVTGQTLITTKKDDTYKYPIRVVYDFKTNQMVAAWAPDGSTITVDMSVTADMMLVRTSQNAAKQIHFSSGQKISDVKTMIGAIEFRRDSIVGRVSNFAGDVMSSSGNRAFRELMLYISFPFDVAVQDIYGIGQLNKEWYLQYYDGAERARKGFFRGDGTTTFWKYMTLQDTLRANVGYSLLLDNDYFNSAAPESDNVWHNIKAGGSVYLYFPSVKELDAKEVIKSGSADVTLPANEHTSGRTFEVESRTLNHNFTDSHWNMMGVPLFENQAGLSAYFDYDAEYATTPPSAMPGGGKGYFYEWDSLENELNIHSAAGYVFKSMHGYMVQYSGTVTFTGSSIQPASVAARKTSMKENYTMELQLLQNEKRVSRAYIELRDEACDTFALNEDVYMIYTSRPADLFTYAGNYDVSANVLSVGNHTIPVGVEVHKAGSFTFTMPSNFSGAATLIDTQTGARTNLALSDYSVTLPKGVCDGRFFIEIDLNKMPTAIDGVEGGSLKDGKAHKFIENGILYILRDGKVFDAQGNLVK